MHRMQNWWFAIQPIVYIFSRWRFIQLSYRTLYLLFVFPSPFLDRMTMRSVRYDLSTREHFSSFVISHVTFAFDTNHTLRLCVRAKCVNVCRTDCFWNSTWISKFFKFSESKLVRNTYVTFANMKISVGSSHTRAKDFNRAILQVLRVLMKMCGASFVICENVDPLRPALVSIYRGVTTNIVGAVFSPVVAIHHRLRRAATNVFIHGPQLISIHIGRRADGHVYNVQ